MLKRPKPEEQNWQCWLDAYRQEHNHVRPHAALKMEVPAQHWKPSSHSFLAQPKPWDYSDPDYVRLVRENGGIGLRGEVYFVSRSLIGEKVQLSFWRIVSWSGSASRSSVSSISKPRPLFLSTMVNSITPGLTVSEPNPLPRNSKNKTC